MVERRVEMMVGSLVGKKAELMVEKRVVMTAATTVEWKVGRMGD